MSLALIKKSITRRTCRNLLLLQCRQVGEVASALREIIKKEQDRVKIILDKYGNSLVDNITVKNLYGGLQGVVTHVCDTSELDEIDGINFRRHTIPDLVAKLPRAADSSQPLPEAMFWLLITGNIPTEKQAISVRDEWFSRSNVSTHIKNIIRSFPVTLCPKAKLCSTLAVMSENSTFNRSYNRKNSENGWEFALEDSMDILAKLPVITAMIYQNTYLKHTSKRFQTQTEPKMDWAMSFAHLINKVDKDFIDFLRLFFVINSDHDGGNISSLSIHVVGSNKIDPYMAYLAGVASLGGPFDSLVTQEVYQWLKLNNAKMLKDPNERTFMEQLRRDVRNNRGIKGYGHSILKKNDPRFECLREYAELNLKNDPRYRQVKMYYQSVPKVIEEDGQEYPPCPSPHALTGIIFRYYGIKENHFLPVLLGMSRALGSLSQLVWSRALEVPPMRVRTISSARLHKILRVEEQNQAKKLNKTNKQKGQNDKT